MRINCSECHFYDIIVRKGDIYTVMTPFGEEAERQHCDDTGLCRYYPPTGGNWSIVEPDDWCSKAVTNF